MAMRAKDILGKSGEQAAAEYLEASGLRILDRNCGAPTARSTSWRGTAHTGGL